MSVGLLESLLARIDELERQVARLTTARSEFPSTLLTSAEVAKRLGTNRHALAERFRRAKREGTDHPLNQLALTVDGTRRWRASDVDSYLATVAPRGGKK